MLELFSRSFVGPEVILCDCRDSAAPFKCFQTGVLVFLLIDIM